MGVLSGQEEEPVVRASIIRRAGGGLIGAPAVRVGGYKHLQHSRLWAFFLESHY